MSGSVWQISTAERKKHDSQFMSLKPVGNFVTGDQARGYFMKSQLPVQVLGQIWELADLNKDGKMDQHEFSIAVFLIQKKLKGHALPKTLPASLKIDPTAAASAPADSFGGLGSLNLGTNAASATQPAPSGFHGLQMPGFSTMPRSQPIAPVPMINGTLPRAHNGGFNAPAASAGPTSPPSSTTPVTGTGTGEWGVPQATKLKYTQMFNMHDRQKKGFLTGMEARGILTQSNLTHSVLAQIWGLSDVDNDGKLTCEEFVLAMHLVDCTRIGQTLPTKLPANLIPPSQRRGLAQSGAGLPSAGTGAHAATSLPASGMSSPPQSDAFGDLLGLGMPSATSPPTITGAASSVTTEESTGGVFQLPATFEDKRKENFDKGAKELEKRRAQLKEEQQKMEEERLAKERAEAEKREQQRLEQERKKQQEMEKLLQKQRELEQQREEQRRKAMEQREAARRALERQRQQEWEKQRLDYLRTEKLQQKHQVETMESAVDRLKQELEKQDQKKGETNIKHAQAKQGVTNITSTIDQMRASRDVKLTEMEEINAQIQIWQPKLQGLTTDRMKLQAEFDNKNSKFSNEMKDLLSDASAKRNNIEQMKKQLEDLEKQTENQIKESDDYTKTLNELNEKVKEFQEKNEKLQAESESKKQEWLEIKKKKQEEAAMMNNINSVGGSNMFSWTSNNVKTITPKSSSTSLNKSEGSKGLSSLAWDSLDVKTTSQSSSVAWQQPDEPETSAWSVPIENKTPTTTVWDNTDKESNKLDDAWGFGTSTNNNFTKIPEDDAWANSAFQTSASDVQDPFANLGSTSWSSNGQFSNKSTSDNLFGSDPFTSQSTYHQPSPIKEPDVRPGYRKHLAIYEFEARNDDEITLKPGDDVWVCDDQSGAEEGWTKGMVADREGWFPSAYVEVAADAGPSIESTQVTSPPAESAPTQEAITEVPATNGDLASSVNIAASEQSLFTAVTSSEPSPVPGQDQSASGELQAKAVYPWRAKKDNHLTFNKGDVIVVKEQQDMWWSGELNGSIGWFPKSYVKLIGNPGAVDDFPQDASDVPPSVEMSNSEPEPIQDTESQVTGELFEAMYTYQSAEAGDLSFNQGEVISVTGKDGDWWTGFIGDRKGMFPANYVKQVENQPTPPPTTMSSSAQVANQQQPMNKAMKKPEIASVLAAYQATGPEQLSLSPGQLIQVRKRSDSGWWEGELQARGQKRRIGWFPANYVKILGAGSNRSTPDLSRSAQNASPLKPSSPNPDPNRGATPQPPLPTTAPALEQVVAQFAYTAQNADELSFEKGCIINVVEKEDGNWWKGELNGLTGVFPSNYVAPLSELGSQADSAS